MNIPSIAPIDSASELLDLLTNSPELKKRMQDMMDLAGLVNDRLKRYKDFETVEALKNQADGRIADAKQRVDAANNYFAEKTRQADNILEQAVQAAEKLKSDSISRETNLRAREQAVEKREEDILAFATDVQKREIEAQRLHVTAEQNMRDTLLMQEKLVSKLNQLQSIASD